MAARRIAPMISSNVERKRSSGRKSALAEAEPEISAALELRRRQSQ
jgi:hypothetical protein